jgi:hypothetical protein
MFEKIGRLAEAAATNVSVSRRGFLGQLGRGALVVAGAVGGLLVFSRDALAAGSYVCCVYQCYYGPFGGPRQGFTRRYCYPPGSSCSSPLWVQCPYGGTLQQKLVNSCNSCK